MFAACEADSIFKVVPTPAKSVRSIRDGDGPPDESWLRSVGFVTAENQYWVWASNKSSGVSLACNTNQGSFHAGDFVISELRSGKEMPKSVRVAGFNTKFQVRCLCAALGITLDEIN